MTRHASAIFLTALGSLQWFHTGSTIVHQAMTSAISASNDRAVGAIVVVDSIENSFILASIDRMAMFGVDDSTVYTINGLPSTRSEALKPGHSAIVIHEAKVATRIDVRSALTPTPERAAGDAPRAGPEGDSRPACRRLSISRVGNQWAYPGTCRNSQPQSIDNVASQ